MSCPRFPRPPIAEGLQACSPDGLHLGCIDACPEGLIRAWPFSLAFGMRRAFWNMAALGLKQGPDLTQHQLGSRHDQLTR